MSWTGPSFESLHRSSALPAAAVAGLAPGAAGSLRRWSDGASSCAGGPG